MNKKLDRAYYDTLEVRKDADADEIKKAYKKASLKAHPDKGGSTEMFQMVNEAWKCLGDVAARAEYDKDIKKYNTRDGQGLKTAKDYAKAGKQNEKEKA